MIAVLHLLHAGKIHSIDFEQTQNQNYWQLQLDNVRNISTVLLYSDGVIDQKGVEKLTPNYSPRPKSTKTAMFFHVYSSQPVSSIT